MRESRKTRIRYLREKLKPLYAVHAACSACRDQKNEVLKGILDLLEEMQNVNT